MNPVPPPGAVGYFRSAFCIGNRHIQNRVVLAPMAGITTQAFRVHVKRYGVGLVYSEMASCYGLLYANSRTAHYVEVSEEERPVGVQLFGDDPSVLSEAVRLVLERERRPDLIDLNLGCPAKKVVKTGAGAALLRDPARAVEVAGAVVTRAAAFGVPVTVKLRSGPDPDHIVAPELAPRLEAVGVGGGGGGPPGPPPHKPPGGAPTRGGRGGGEPGGPPGGRHPVLPRAGRSRGDGSGGGSGLHPRPCFG